MTEGERWTREALRALRSRRYAPRAWLAFLAASFRRFADTRPAHRDAERQVVLITALGLAGAVLLALDRGAGPGVAAGVWWLAVMAMVELHLGMLEREDGTPLRTLATPNILSLLRAAAVPLLLLAGPVTVAAILAATGATDVLDGFVARRFGLDTRLGQWLDGTVDTVVLAAAAVALVRLDLLAVWVAVLIAVRVLAPWLVIAGAYFVRAEAPPRSAFVPGRVPGATALVGLILVAAGVHLGVALVVAGMLGGLATLGISVVRAATSGL